jgi:hypothetical protein
MGKARVITCCDCGKERPNKSKGRCATCANRIRLKAVGFCNQCSRNMPGVSGGICNSCRSKNYRQKHGQPALDKHAAVERARRRRLGDMYREQDRERNKRRREYRVNYSRQYYQANKETFKEKHREWRQNNPQTRNERRYRYRTRKEGLPATLTISEWEAIRDGFDHRCVYCNRQMSRLVKEHTIPVIQGGGYTAENILPACQSCNSRKHTSTGFEFLVRLATEKQTGIRVPGPKRNRQKSS